MGAKVTFDSANRLIIPIGPPDGDGVIAIDVQVDVYSDGKEDWLTDNTLNRFKFPIVAIGGQVTPFGKLGTTYEFKYGWKIRPYEADHTFRIDGNVYSDDSLPLVVDTIGTYNVRIESTISTIVSNLSTLEAKVDFLTSLLANDRELLTGSVDNEIIYDENGRQGGAGTPLRRFNVTDPDGNPITVGPGDPAIRTAGTP